MRQHDGSETLRTHLETSTNQSTNCDGKALAMCQIGLPPSVRFFYKLVYTAQLILIMCHGG